MQTAPLEIKPIWHKKLQFVFSTCRFADFSVPTRPAHTANHISLMSHLIST